MAPSSTRLSWLLMRSLIYFSAAGHMKLTGTQSPPPPPPLQKVYQQPAYSLITNDQSQLDVKTGKDIFSVKANCNSTRKSTNWKFSISIKGTQICPCVFYQITTVGPAEPCCLWRSISSTPAGTATSSYPKLSLSMSPMEGGGRPELHTL